MAGNVEAEAELVNRYKDGISFILNRIVRNQFTAEDLSQEAFIIALQKIRHGDVRDPERLSGFMVSVARYHAIEHLRKHKESTSKEEMGTVEDLPDSAPTPYDEVLSREKSATVRQVIGEMKAERDRQVLLRYYLAEKTRDEVCAELGLTNLQFDKIIYWAKNRFKDLYIQLVGGP